MTTHSFQLQWVLVTNKTKHQYYAQTLLYGSKQSQTEMATSENGQEQNIHIQRGHSLTNTATMLKLLKKSLYITFHCYI